MKCNIPKCNMHCKINDHNIAWYLLSCNQNMSSDSKRLKCSPYHHFKWPCGGFVLLDPIHLGSASPEIHREGIFPLRHT